MRILTFLHSFEPGGVERVALRLIRRWREQGVDAPLFLGRSDGAIRAELGAGLDAHIPRQPPFSVSAFETLWMIATLPAFIRRQRPDALFCAGNSYAVVAVAMKLLLGRACPPILAKISNDLERRDMIWPARMAYRLWLRIQGRFIDHFVAMAPGLEQEIAALIRPKNGAVSIIPDPALSLEQIDRLRAVRAARGGKGRLFVAIGRLARQKNIPLMLDAFSRVADADDRLLIFGDGPARKALEARAGRLGMGDRVRFMGHVADPALQIGRADAFLLSSDYEGVPAVLLEALAVGLPVVATECSAAMRSLLADGALGRLTPVGDVTAFAAAIREAPMPQDDFVSLRLTRRFTLDAASTAYLDRFDKICARTAEVARIPCRQPHQSTMTSHL
ncbi:glycosyltransferase [Sphingobium sp. Sx8-8]|uniref:glycosyltransferase n=1 Tax=Sphingobium sp. Sx8-8 TaxID=2933617 RepID=UPI001F57AF62|nr:glycosyltransferase [Sphingobium sp. Sx8-8]